MMTLAEDLQNWQQDESGRKSGILLHISSLPGKYGIGDFGKVAYEFVDFLYNAKQTYWQILPLNVTDGQAGYSPYSSISPFAGNTMFISPDLLFEENLIDPKSVEIPKFRENDKVDFEKAIRFRENLLIQVFKNFEHSSNHQLREEFQHFCEHEKYWLHDYALFITIKNNHQRKPWNQWPVELRNRDIYALREFEGKHAETIEMEKFNQFLFLRQWKKLRAYANERGIKIYGDVPIYIGYDSADVWSKPEFFYLDDQKNMIEVAGVPPDYFNSNGQLWGMPLYRWDYLRHHHYNWWIDRIRKNFELFDLVRLDHFRGFAGYWSVPATEKTAINGQWVTGPGEDFFHKIASVFHHMPFVAEDLGQIDQPVYDLRNKFNFPGMVVLQFAFSSNMPQNIHIMHNHSYNSIVYSGTHDNNTVRGWFSKELDKNSKRLLRTYFGRKINSGNCAAEIIRLVYMSPAKIAIVPMQDFLNLGPGARMNTPSTTTNNWSWKLKRKQLSKKLELQIKSLVWLYWRK